jgi:hypothetical protein
VGQGHGWLAPAHTSPPGPPARFAEARRSQSQPGSDTAFNGLAEAPKGGSALKGKAPAGPRGVADWLRAGRFFLPGGRVQEAVFEA